MTRSVAILDTVIDAMLSHAQEAAPRECCGLLLGTAATVVDSVRARNVAADPERRYRVDPRDHLAAIRAARAQLLDVVGAYHSHPQSAALPSATDAAEAFAEFLFLIVGLASDPPEIAAWRWEDGNFTAFPLVRFGKG